LPTELPINLKIIRGNSCKFVADKEMTDKKTMTYRNCMKNKQTTTQEEMESKVVMGPEAPVFERVLK